VIFTYLAPESAYNNGWGP